MDKGLAVAVAAVVGGLVGMQAPANAILGRAVGSLPAAAFSLVVSTLLLVVFIGEAVREAFDPKEHSRLR